MKKLIIIGAGGFGRSINTTVKECVGYGIDFVLKGFLDFPNVTWNTIIYAPIIGVETEYVIEPEDVFVCSIGNVERKKQVTEYILNKGGQFINLVHNTAFIALDASIGKGNIILKNVYIDSCATIGNFNLIQTMAIIGHDAVIGNHIRIDCNVVCVGGIVIKDEATIHTSAVISHGVTVGKRAIVGALSLVIRKVKDDTTVVGNPALRLR